MKRVLLSFLINIAIMVLSVNAQIYQGGDLRLSTQEEIDTFNYTEVRGNLFIEESVPGNITNLRGLKSLTKISRGVPSPDYGFTGGLIIQLNIALKNLDGLENLRSVVIIEMNGNGIEDIEGLSGITFAQGIGLANNHRLTNLDGLSNLDSVSSWLSIFYNFGLNNIDGLSGLRSAARVEISGNTPLENVDGLANLGSTETLIISDNPSLNNIDGLAGLGSDTLQTLQINNNPLLFQFCGLYNLLTKGYVDSLSIENNGANPTREEIIAECSPPDNFPYMTFWAVNDADEDGTVGSLYYYTLSEAHYFDNIEGNIEGINRKDIEDLTIADDGTFYIVNNFITSGIYKINPNQLDKDPETPVLAEFVGDTKLPAGALPEEISSLCFINGTLYGLGKETKILYSINTSNGSVTEVAELNVDEFRTDGLVMGADSTVYLLKTLVHGPSEIWKFDEFPGGNISRVTVVEGSGKLEAIAAHPNGNLYAADINNLYEINLNENTIGVLDDYSVDIEGMAFNYRAEMLKPVQEVRKFRIIGTLTDVSETSLKPTAYYLSQNFPNPLNPSTVIKYSLPEAVHVKINVYNSLGEIVRTLVSETKSSGNYEISFDAGGLPSGVYIYRIEAGKFTQSRKMILLR